MDRRIKINVNILTLDRLFSGDLGVYAGKARAMEDAGIDGVVTSTSSNEASMLVILGIWVKVRPALLLKATVTSSLLQIWSFCANRMILYSSSALSAIGRMVEKAV